MFEKRKSAKFGMFSLCKRRDRRRLSRATEIVESELDIVSFMRKQMTDRIAWRLLFTQKERFMIRHQESPFVLTERKRSSDSEQYDQSEFFRDIEYSNES